MKILGLEIGRSKPVAKAGQQIIVDTNQSSGFLSFIRESFAGAWQRNIVVDRSSVLAYFAVYSCMSLISADIGKLRPKIMKPKGKVNVDVIDKDYTKLLKRPNKYQTWQKFAEQYALSKLSHGNTYVLLVRDNKRVVVEMHVLNPMLIKTLITEDGDVYYQPSEDRLAHIAPENASYAIPSSDMIHDTMVCLFHPLVGVSPIYACGLAATQGLTIQRNSTTFFDNMSRPSGMLTAPAKISDETANRLKKEWENNFTSGNIGKLAVLGDNLKYEAMTISALDSQMLEQLKWTAETVCSCFHVPAYKIGVGAIPTYNNAEVLNQIYYTDCLQAIIQSMECHIEYGLGLPDRGELLELELDGLIRMDTATQIETLNKAVQGGWLTPNEARQKRNLGPVKGGDTPYMQQQNYSLSALADRDVNDPLNPKNQQNNNNNQNQVDPAKVDEAAKSYLAQLIEKTKKLFVAEEKES